VLRTTVGQRAPHDGRLPETRSARRPVCRWVSRGAREMSAQT